MSLICSKYLNDFLSYLSKAKVWTLAHKDLHYLALHYFSNLFSISLSSFLHHFSNITSKRLPVSLVKIQLYKHPLFFSVIFFSIALIPFQHTMYFSYLFCKFCHPSSECKLKGIHGVSSVLLLLYPQCLE